MATLLAPSKGRYALTRPPRDDDELYSLVQALWGITIPRAKVCHDHDAPFDSFATAFFAREPMTLVHGSRGLGGKSRMASILGITNAVVWGSDVNILGGSMAQSANIHEAMREAWDSEASPEYMLRDSTQLLIRLSHGAKIRPLTASQKTVRGPHPARLILDEIDEMDQAILDASLGQPMPQKNWMGVQIPAQTHMCSTWQYADGTFAEMHRRFKANNLPVYTWCYKESANPYDGWLDPAFIEQKKREIPAEMWRVEYELGEPSIGNRAFDTDSVERMFEEKADEGLVKQSKAYEEYKFLDYVGDKDYVIAADWAKSQDFTVISVWEVTDLPIKLAYWVRVNRQPYPKMIDIFNKLQKAYRAEGIHDATGLGGVVSDLIDGQVWNFIMSGRERDDMLTEFVSAVENDRVRAPRISSFYSAVKYCRVEDLYSRAKEFHLPDEVCSAALAWRAVSNRYPAVNPLGLPKTERNWMQKQVETNGQHLMPSSPWVDGKVETKSDLAPSWEMAL